jgi:hypothetical protein
MSKNKSKGGGSTVTGEIGFSPKINVFKANTLECHDFLSEHSTIPRTCKIPRLYTDDRGAHSFCI